MRMRGFIISFVIALATAQLSEAQLLRTTVAQGEIEGVEH